MGVFSALRRARARTFLRHPSVLTVFATFCLKKALLRAHIHVRRVDVLAQKACGALEGQETAGGLVAPFEGPEHPVLGGRVMEVLGLSLPQLLLVMHLDLI